MSTLAIETARAEARKDQVVNGFSGEVRSIENTGLEVDDVLIIPETFKVYERKFGDNKAQYIFCELEGTDQVKAFYPSTFTKRRTVYNEDGTSAKKNAFTTGTATELFRSFGDVKSGMDALKGKKIKVTAINEARTRRFNSTELMMAQFPVLDLVD